ncbi:hypothetical protein LCGC14_1596730 [marine sediment metagenome]|uniref:Uncharacterized protein n=1 Tax=marine sediment metagenome TaxID=412755 RepID=A0A0F9KSZ6_9ZZZZ
MHYQTADAQLQGRNRESRKLANNTYLRRRGEDIAVQLHATDVVTYHPDGSTTLNSGGWRTVTTKDRMNAYGPVQVWQDRGVWYIGKGWQNKGTVYADGITVLANGSITGQGTATPTADRRIKAQVSKYAKLCSESLPLDEPGAGDCWYCSMYAQGERTLGDMTHSNHFDSHMAEGYVVPSLVYNALKEAGAGQAYYWGVFGVESHPNMVNQVRPTVRRMVYRYILKRYGFAV